MKDAQTIQFTIYPDGRMDGKNAAAYLGLSQKTLAMMRCAGDGPKFIKRGRVFYFKEDLDEWIARAGRFTSTAQVALHKSMHMGARTS
jgi:hypothetical protein